MSYSYDYPHPAVTADAALFTAQDGRLSLLLIRRDRPPFEGCWALPGGFMDIGETLGVCARRELAEETGVTDVTLEPVGVFDRPDRDPRERVITLVHAGALRAGEGVLQACSDARQVQWFALEDLPPLAFDHDDVIARLRLWLRRHPDPLGLALGMLPKDFAPGDLVALYQAITSV